MAFQIPIGKQADFITGSDARVNIAHGSVRSAKTVGCNIRWLEAILKNPGRALMVGKTLGALERNVLLPIQGLVGAGNFEYKRSLKTARIYGREVWCEGANDESAYEKIAGQSLQIAYVDEGSLCPMSFWDMLISRLSEKDAQLFTTSNPGNPAHYLKKNWLDREDELDLKAWHFTLDDNPWLDPAYVKELKRQFTGLFYQRYILGLWVVAEGSCYQNFDRSLHVVPRLPDGKPDQLRVGVDWGATHPTAFLKMYRYGQVWYAAGEYRKSDLTNGELAKDLQDFIGGQFPTSIEVDPSAKSFRLELRAAGIQGVHAADNAVTDGIARVGGAFGRGDLKIVGPSCPMLVEEIEGYRWDQKASDRGEDQPIKEKDDLVDALRYVANKIFKRPINITRRAHTHPIARRVI
ncbi:MAG: PBSX family phage terminase large subunit [Methanotrichaceae archaeon]